MQVLLLLMAFSLATIAVCFVGALISAQPSAADLLYFGAKLDTPLAIFVPCLFFGVLHLVVVGFALNLFCYHLWLRRHGLTTLEHILKYKGSKKLGQIRPLPPSPSEPTGRLQERVVVRQPLKLKSTASVSDRPDEELVLSDHRLKSQKSSTATDGLVLGRPKTKLEKAEEFFRLPERKLPSKLSSESASSLTGKESTERQLFPEQSTLRFPLSAGQPLTEKSKALAKPVAGKDGALPADPQQGEQSAVVKKVQKRRLAPLAVDTTENSKASRAKE